LSERPDRQQKGADQANRWPRIGDVATVGLLAAIALLLGIALHPLAVDDAFITYRYAHHFATGQGFTYNLDRPVLSTTAPLYALILAAGALAWPDLPSLANGLSAVALWAAATLVFILSRREKTPWVGGLAALLLVAHPLLWLSLGLETALFLALALAAIAAYQSRRLRWAAILLALATLTRGDGLILTGVLAFHCVLGWLTRWGYQTRGLSVRTALEAVGIYVAVLLPLLAWLTWRFGSPLPATLGAKAAQTKLGITGFYPHTTYGQGAWILARARLVQSPLYALFVPAVAAGLIVTWRRGRWVRLVVVWSVSHLAGYAILGVTPYYWYYAPLVPALACLAALGVVESARWLARRVSFRQGVGRAVAWGVGGLWAAALLVALGQSDWAMVQALDGPVPPPDDPVSKVLPEAKVGVYRETGLWLRDHTPADAVVGVTEVGIIGYYAERTMVDFLGLLEPEVAQALGRGDLYWALLRYQPDYLALTAISPLYAYDLRADPWFQAAYAPLQTFSDTRFWGSPVTVYHRRVARVPLTGQTAAGLPAGMIRLDADFGGQVRLLGAVASDGGQESTIRPGDVVALTLYWQALEPVPHDYTVFIHLLGEHDRVIAQRDAPPGLGARPTSQWRPGQVLADPHLLVLPETAYAPDQAVWEVGLYDAQTGHRLPTDGGGDNVRFGTVSVLPSLTPLRLDFGPVALTGYELDRLALSPGETLRLTLHWDVPSTGASPVQVTVQLADERGNVEAQVSHRLGAAPPNEDVYHLVLGADAPPGAYDLEVVVADPVTAQTLPLLGADGQPRGDRARLTKVRLYP